MAEVQELELLDRVECLRVRQEVHALRAEWTVRHTQVPFFTLGAASYLDASPKKRERYVALLSRTNPILQARFGWLYERVAAALASLTGQPAVYPAQQHERALPGFHIYLSCAAFAHPVASVHMDLQHHNVSWEAPDEMDFSQRYSFTLSVALPRAGAGLKVWQIPEAELRNRRWDDVCADLGKHEVTFHPYTPGHMVVHSGEAVHQAVLMPEVKPDDERITLQGHLALRRDTWQIYW